MVLADSAFVATLGLVVTFVGIGLLVNGLIVFIVAQGLGERSRKLPPAAPSPPPGQDSTPY